MDDRRSVGASTTKCRCFFSLWDNRQNRHYRSWQRSLPTLLLCILDDTGFQRKTQRPCHVASLIDEQGNAAHFDIRPWDRLSFLHSAIALLQIHAHMLLEVRQTDLTVLVWVHNYLGSVRFFPIFAPFSWFYYTTKDPLCAATIDFCDHSVDITIYKQNLTVAWCEAGYWDSMEQISLIYILHR